jgi:hypothetical protein
MMIVVIFPFEPAKVVKSFLNQRIEAKKDRFTAPLFVVEHPQGVAAFCLLVW